MTDRERDLEQKRPEAGPLRRVVLDEPLGVWVGCCEPNDVEATLSACADLSDRGGFTLVLWLPRALSPEHATRALTRAGGLADTLVLIASEEDRRRWGALGENDVCAIARGGGDGRVLIEPDPKRAVVGAMQWLGPHDTFCVLWPSEQGRLALDGLIVLGATWRGAWDEPENGEFHDCPRGPDDLLVPQHTTQDRSKRGEDR